VDTSKPARPNWAIIIVAAAFLLPPAFSIFGLLQEAGTPALIAGIGAGGVDILMVMAGLWALQLGEEGVATWPANLSMVALAAVSITAQIWHAVLMGEVLTGVVLATLAVGGVGMIEGQLRRVHRINARRDGRLPMARPRPTLEQRFYFPREAGIATKLAVANPDTTAKDVFDRALQITAEMDKPKAPPERQALALGATLPGLPTVTTRVIESGKGPDAVPDSPDGDSGEVRAIGGQARSVSAQVRAMVDAGATDDQAITAAVIRMNPGANPESIRRVLRAAKKANEASA
jgi:hypothetical protein